MVGDGSNDGSMAELSKSDPLALLWGWPGRERIIEKPSGSRLISLGLGRNCDDCIGGNCVPDDMVLVYASDIDGRSNCVDLCEGCSADMRCWWR